MQLQRIIWAAVTIIVTLSLVLGTKSLLHGAENRGQAWEGGGTGDFMPAWSEDGKGGKDRGARLGGGKDWKPAWSEGKKGKDRKPAWNEDGGKKD